MTFRLVQEFFSSPAAAYFRLLLILVVCRCVQFFAVAHGFTRFIDLLHCHYRRLKLTWHLSDNSQTKKDGEILGQCVANESRWAALQCP